MIYRVNLKNLTLVFDKHLAKIGLAKSKNLENNTV